jgi:diguanylate cyclase (GGDEF)-like protein/PAS domain S-box-containing protein
MRTTQDLQQRISALLWVMVLAVLLSVSLGSYWFFGVIEKIGARARQETSDLIALEEALGDAMSELADQTQEWKDSLLRAHDPVAFARHRRGFQLHAQAVQSKLEHAERLMQRLGLNSASLPVFKREHSALVERYEAALSLLDPKQTLSFRAVDESVRGADRKLQGSLRAQYQSIESDVAVKIASLGRAGGNRFLLDHFFEVGALALVLPLFAFAAFFATFRMLRQLRQSDRRARTIFEAIGDATLVTDALGRVQSLNDSARALMGWPGEEAIGKPLDEVFQLFDTQHLAQVESPVDVVLRERKPIPLSNGMQLRRRDGSFIAIEDSAAPVLDAHDELIGVVMVFHDVTERYAMLSDLRRERALFEQTFNQAAVGMAHVSADGSWLSVNRKLCEMTGYSRSELLAFSFRGITHPDDLELDRIGMRDLLSQSKDVYTAEKRYICKDGRVVWVALTVSIVCKEDGTPDFGVSIIEDIDARKQAEQALRRQVRFVKALNELAEVIAVNDSAGTILERSVEIIGNGLAVDRALIYHVSFEQEKVTGLCEWLNRLHPDIEATKATFPLDVFIGGATEMMRTRQHFVSQADAINPHLLEDGSGQILHHQMMIQSLLWYPFDFRDQSYHLLVLNQVHANRQWTLEEIDFIAGVSQQLSIALNKLKMLDEQRRAAQDLRVAAMVFESQHCMTITNAECIIQRVNDAFIRVTGYSAEEAVGQNPRLLGSGRHDAAFYAAMWASIETTGCWQGEIWNRRKNGEVYPEWLGISTVKDDAGLVTHYVAVFTDISARKAAERQIENLAFYDPLTQLPNRRLMLDRLDQVMTGSARHQRGNALLFIDLDNFKSLNDTLGHSQGDLLLTQVAKRLSGMVREGDTVARLGSDEFVVIIEDLSENPLEAAAQADAVGSKVLANLNQAYQLDAGLCHIAACIGVTLFGSNELETTDEPLRRAELAMYQAKVAGRNTLRFFDLQIQDEVMARVALEADLREAVRQDQFVIHYQAQVVGDGRLTGAEVLVRWRHPQRGLVSPGEFIPLAEETGLILPLGQWVLETACRQLAAWAVQPAMAHLTLAVNVSARQFHYRDFVDQVLAVLERTGANPRRLKLELTEGMLVADMEGIVSKMILLKAEGVGFSLDDFGTGYSSLSYLKRLPLDQLKIDQSFVRNILTDPDDAAIAQMVIALANSLGLAVIAEGVEILAQADFLAQQGCHAYQGYFFNRPVPIDSFEEYARAH